MKDERDPNTCYVFSQNTLNLALQEWIDEVTNNGGKSDSSNNQQRLIAAAAIPWFLKHINQAASIKMFTHKDLLTEIIDWKSAQIREYPQQQKRIEESCQFIIDFFLSEIVTQHKMTVHT